MALGMLAFLWLMTAVASGFLAGSVATSKGHGQQWFLVGLLLGPLGVIAAAGLGDRITQKHLRRLAATAPELDQKEDAATSKITYRFQPQEDTTVTEVPRHLIRESAEKWIFHNFGNEFQRFTRAKEDQLYSHCINSLKQKLGENVLISLLDLHDVLREMAQEKIIEVTTGPLGGVSKIRVIRKEMR